MSNKKRYAAIAAKGSIKPEVKPPITPIKAYDSMITKNEHPAQMVTVGADGTRTTDAFSNPAARLGFGSQNLLEATEYPLTRMTYNYALLNSLYRGNWIVQRIISTVPEDVLRSWPKISGDVSPDDLEKLDRLQRTTHLRAALLEGMRWGRLYGGAAGLILIDGQEDMLSEPIDFDTIMPDSFRGLYIVDRWSGVYPDTHLIDDINDPDFGLPEYYEIRNENDAAVAKVHHSRVVRFTGRELPYWEKVAELYWGESEIESIYEEIVKRDNVSNNIAALTFRASLSVREIANLDQILGVGGSQAQQRFWDIIQAQSVLESNMGIQLVNKGESIQRQNYTFSGLSDVYNSVMMDVSGAAQIPVTKLFGRSPAGLNATGESDMENYDAHIEEERESNFRPIYEQILPIMAISAWGYIPDDLKFDFEAVRTPSEVEKADIIRKKVDALTIVYKSGGMTRAAYMTELSKMQDQYGVFASIDDAMIAAGEGKYYNDADGLTDPLAGLEAAARSVPETTETTEEPEEE